MALGDQALGPLEARTGAAIAKGYREAVPAQYRLFLSTMLGDRSAITQNNFSPAEMQTLQRLVAKDQAYLPKRAADQRSLIPVWDQLANQARANLTAVRGRGRDLTADQAMQNGVSFQGGKSVPLAAAIGELSDDYQHAVQMRDQAANVARRASHGVGAIRYDAPDQMSQDVAGGYPYPQSRENRMVFDPQQRIGPFKMGLDYGDRNVNALANTLGEFVYKPAPDGGTTIDDNYNWGHFREPDKGGKPWGMGEALAMAIKTGNLEPLISNVLPDRQAGRPVHIALPPPASQPQ